MADSGTPKCGSCSQPTEGAPDSGTPDTCPENTVPATDPCVTGSECEETEPSPCEEDHCQTVIQKTYSATVKALNSFNFPDIGEPASLTLDSVESLLPGSILWNRSVGRLYVESFDATTSTAVVTNRGDSCDATAKTPGDAVPACTEFAVGIPECDAGSGGNNSDVVPFLAADFVGPAVDACQLASVTNTNGINVNDIVSINTFQYRVQDIPDANTLNLCNEGQGAPTGQVIEWDANCDDIPDVQVVSVSSDDPCNRDGVNSGVIVVCDEGVRKPLVGSAESQIPVWDNAAQKFRLQIVSLPETCTFLTVCLTVDVGNAGPYVATVEDTSIFTDGDVVEIDGDAFTVTEVVDGTRLRLTALVVPAAIKEYAVGETVCIQDCCVTLPERVQNIEETINDPCYMKGLYDSFYFNFASQILTFQPTDQGGGVYQQYYDIGDPALPAEFFRETIALPDDGCSYVVQATCFMHMSLAILGTDPNLDDLRQFHEFILAVNGDVTSAEPRMVASQRGALAAVTDLDCVNNAAPANFLLNFYPCMIDHYTLSTYREITVNVAGTDPDPEFFIGHRLALSDNRNVPNWAGGTPAARLEWGINGAVEVNVFRLINP